ncbi:MAG: imidazole glycerol phosphate synthase subunit HisH [Anaerolineae bacterium]
MSRPLTIIDYGAGNLRNVQKAFAAVGVEALISSDPASISRAPALVLPGVGAFGDAIDNLRERHLEQPLLQGIAEGKPLLGICVGLQLLFEESEEMGLHRGLGLLPGRVVRFAEGLTVPHMGWNQIAPQREHPLLDGLAPGDFAYFAHSYHAQPSDPSVIVAQTDYGRPFPSIVARKNVCAIQFHPEKSQQFGLRLLKNFAKIAQEVELC